ncbi:uncharacterized protein LOC114244181 isoform X1 [Bombyx mandarina]|nr:uncharacterized protein LOC114244181 isoform X1 [Bombyx mandarina]
MIIVYAVYVLAVYTVRGNESNSSRVLGESLRRQLMDDNYDYQPSETEELLHPQDITRRQGVALNKQDTDLDSINIFVPETINNQYIITEDKDTGQDMLHHLDDRPTDIMTSDQRDYVELHDDGTKPTQQAKYKILKVKNPSRRSMGSRRFIQEEKEDGVAIISLDDGTFPEFRLPKDRRQYMQDGDDLDDLGLDLDSAGPDFVQNKTKHSNDDYLSDLIPTFNVSDELNRV